MPSPPVSIPPGLPMLCLEHAPLPMAMVEGATHIVRYVNPAFCGLMKKPMKKLMGKPLPGLLPRQDQCVALLDRVFQTGEPASHTEQDNSQTHPAFWSYTMWPLQEDKGLVGIMLQVTETLQRHEAKVAMNEALLLGSLRQHELTEAAEVLNAELRREIQERQETARELAEKARLLNLTHDAIIVRGIDGGIRYWNHGAEEMYGWSSGEVIGKESNALFHTEYPTSLADITAELHRTGRWTGELVHTRHDGLRITVLVRKTLDRDNQGNPASVLQNITDITERKRAEEAVRLAGERFRFMAESMPQKIFTAKANGGADYYNKQWLEYTGLAFDEICDWGWTRFVHPQDLEGNLRRWKQCLGTGEYFEMEHRILGNDGLYRWHITRANAMRDSTRQITMWIGSTTDIDDVMQVQEELVKAEALLADRSVHLETLVAERTEELTVAHAQLLTEAEERKRLEAEIAGAIEGERARLGQELHDGLVQELTGIAMMLFVLEQQLKKTAPKQAREAHRLCGMMEQAHGNARDLAKSVYPVELEQHGLAAALEGMAQRIGQHFGVKCRVETGSWGTTGAKDPTSVQLLRIAQEAVQNAAKHARAKTILIHLSQADGSWLLSVRDDGTGLPETDSGTGGMGLRIMQYRARIIHGTLSVANAVGGGVLVSCIAPTKDPS